MKLNPLFDITRIHSQLFFIVQSPIPSPTNVLRLGKWHNHNTLTDCHSQRDFGKLDMRLIPWGLATVMTVKFNKALKS